MRKLTKDQRDRMRDGTTKAPQVFASNTAAAYLSLDVSLLLDDLDTADAEIAELRTWRGCANAHRDQAYKERDEALAKLEVAREALESLEFDECPHGCLGSYGQRVVDEALAKLEGEE